MAHIRRPAMTIYTCSFVTHICQLALCAKMCAFFLAHICVEQTHEKRIDTYLGTKTHRAETIARKLGKKPHIKCVIILKQMAHHWKATGDCYERQSSLREQAKVSWRTFRSLMPIENPFSHSIDIRYLWQVQFMSLMQFFFFSWAN